MRRLSMLALIVLLTVAAATTAIGAAQAAKPTKLQVWLPFTARELGVMKRVIGEYDAKHPEVTVSVSGNIDTTKIVAAIRAGDAPDLAMDFESANVGTYCSSGAWLDLGPYLKRAHVDVKVFPAAARYYTQYRGTRCALPLPIPRIRLPTNGTKSCSMAWGCSDRRLRPPGSTPNRWSSRCAGISFSTSHRRGRKRYPRAT